MNTNSELRISSKEPSWLVIVPRQSPVLLTAIFSSIGLPSSQTLPLTVSEAAPRRASTDWSATSEPDRSANGPDAKHPVRPRAAAQARAAVAVKR